MSDPDSEVERYICVIFGRHPEHFAAVKQITTPLGRDTINNRVMAILSLQPLKKWFFLFCRQSDHPPPPPTWAPPPEHPPHLSPPPPPPISSSVDKLKIILRHHLWTVHTINYVHVLHLVVFYGSEPANFIHIRESYFIDIETAMPQCQWHNPEWYG